MHVGTHWEAITGQHKPCTGSIYKHISHETRENLKRHNTDIELINESDFFQRPDMLDNIYSDNIRCRTSDYKQHRQLKSYSCNGSTRSRRYGAVEGLPIQPTVNNLESKFSELEEGEKQSVSTTEGNSLTLLLKEQVQEASSELPAVTAKADEIMRSNLEPRSGFKKRRRPVLYFK